MNNTIAKIKNTLEVTNSGITKTEEWVSEQEDSVVEINAEEQEKKKIIIEASFRELLDNIK